MKSEVTIREITENVKRNNVRIPEGERRKIFE